MTGETVSHYRVLEQLGGGAMGVVYKAHDTRLKRVVALKFLPPELTRDADAKRRFVQEAEAASALDHPNVCTVHDIDESADGRVFLAMAFYDGETLKHRIQRGPLPIDDVVSFALQMASALQTAHDAGIVHRDVKPANIMITARGEVKLLDFGVAKLAGHADLTQTGSSVGTVAYMAPEQFDGQVDQRADLWALGVVIYEMLTGRRPFDGADYMTTMNAVFHHQPAAPATLRAESPTALAAVIDRALQKKPAQRYSTAAEMAADLQTSRPGAAANLASAGVLRTLARPIVAGPMVAVLAVLGYLLVNSLMSQSGARWARETAIPEITRLLQGDEYVPAHALAQQASRYIPGDPVLAELQARITGSPPFVITKPATARVSARPYTEKSAWQPLGSGSMTGVLLPRGAYVFRIEADGFETMEIARTLINLEREKPVPIEMQPTEKAAGGMVQIPASNGSVELTGFAVEAAVPVPPYAIDKYEVSNRQFKEFVDAGGYRTQAYWKLPIVHDGRRLSWTEAMALFRDSSGRSGPSTWEVGSYPEGHADRPVGGVSWYEAAAYAEFRKASLPTIYHWARAALAYTRPAPIRGLIVKASNYAGKETRPVGSSGAIGPYGAYDLAGNVREWCLNESGANRWILGGAFGQDEYTYVLPYSLPPTDRSAINGFRLAAYPKAEGLEALLQAQELLRRDFRTVKPVNDEMFAIFKRQLAPVPAPVNAKIESSESPASDWSRDVVSIDTGLGDRMRLFIFVPRNGKTRHPAVILFPGLGSFFASVPGTAALPSLDALPGSLAGSGAPDFLVRSGRILVIPVWKGMTERSDGFLALTGERYLTMFRQRMREWTQEQSQVLDYLASRPDVNPEGFSYWGGSFGASTALPVLAMESRYKAATLQLAGFTFRPLLPEVDASNFVSRITIPVLMLEGRYDHLFPVELSQQPLFNLLGAPAARKRMVHFDAGHGLLPRGRVIHETLSWLDRYVGPLQ